MLESVATFYTAENITDSSKLFSRNFKKVGMWKSDCGNPVHDLKVN